MAAFIEKYSSALVSLANEENKFSEYRKQVKKILDIFDENKELNRFFANQMIYKNELKTFIDEVFKNKFDSNIVNFMKVVVDKGRGPFMEKIFRQFDIDCNRQLNIKIGTIYSVLPLSKKEIKDVEEVISKQLNEEVVLHPKIDTSLIAGIKVRVEDKIFDNSISYRLSSLRASLLEKVGDA